MLICEILTGSAGNVLLGRAKAIPLQAWTGPDGSRWLRLQDFKTVATWSWQGCQSNVPAAFTSQKIFLVLISVHCAVAGSNPDSVFGIFHHHHHHISVMELGHLLTRSGLTYPEVSSKVCHDTFCQLGNSVSLPWVIYYGAFYLHVVSSFSCIPVICLKLVLCLIPFAICAFVL